LRHERTPEKTRAGLASSCEGLECRPCVAQRRYCEIPIDTPETESLPWSPLRDQAEIGRDGRRDDGIAAGRLMLREQDDRCATRRDLHSAGEHTGGQDLAFARSDPRSAQARAHAVASGFDAEFGAEEQGIGLIGETLRVRARDGAYLSGVVIRTDRQTTSPLDIYAGAPEREGISGALCVAEAGRKIGRAAPKDRFGRYASGYREVGEPRALAADDGEGLAGTGERRGPAGHKITRAKRDVAPGHRHDAAVVAAKREPVANDLDRRGDRVVADEGLRRAKRCGIRGTGRRDALTKMTEAAAVLDVRAQTRRPYMNHDATNRTRSPGRMSAGGSLVASNIRRSVRPMSRHPPGESNG